MKYLGIPVTHSCGTSHSIAAIIQSNLPLTHINPLINTSNWTLHLSTISLWSLNQPLCFLKLSVCNYVGWFFHCVSWSKSNTILCSSFASRLIQVTIFSSINTFCTFDIWWYITQIRRGKCSYKWTLKRKENQPKILTFWTINFLWPQQPQKRKQPQIIFFLYYINDVRF